MPEEVRDRDWIARCLIARNFDPGIREQLDRAHSSEHQVGGDDHPGFKRWWNAGVIVTGIEVMHCSAEDRFGL